MAEWPHAPSRKVLCPGTYIITAGTMYKQRFFDSPAKLNLLQDICLESFSEFGWDLHAWAVFSNHYHAVVTSPETTANFAQLTRKIHGKSAIELNKLDSNPGCTVWYRYWQTLITNQVSYMARLAYVHFNPVKHGLVEDPKKYRWCSAAWFERTADPPFYRTVVSMKHDRVNVIDDF